MAVTTDAACPHNPAFKPANCVDCMNETGLGAEPQEPLTVVGTFNARFVGVCAARDCRGDIWPGQRISRLSDDTYVHELCARDRGAP